MRDYNYFNDVKKDVKDWLEVEYQNELDELTSLGAFDRENFEYELKDRLWNEDSITGNASGSYTMSTYSAEINLCHNLNLLVEACKEFGCDVSEAIKQGAEYCDVTIRCYLLSYAIHDVLSEIWDRIDNGDEVFE